MNLQTLQDKPATRTPLRVVQVPVNAWAGCYPERPSAPMPCGIRLVSEHDVLDAMVEAAKFTVKVMPKTGDQDRLIEAYNDMLVRWIVARGTCDPQDTAAPWAGWKGIAEDAVMSWMAPGGLRFLFDQIEQVRIECDPAQREASDEEVEQFSTLFMSHAARITGTQSRRLRRLLGFCIDQLLSVEG